MQHHEKNNNKNRKSQLDSMSVMPERTTTTKTTTKITQSGKWVPEVSPERLHEYKEAFNMFDKNGDGRISHDELRQVLETMNPGTKIDEPTLSSMIAELDIDGNGTVEFNEFVAWQMRNWQSATENSDAAGTDLKTTFDVFDRNKDGYIDFKELEEVMEGMGERLTDKEIGDMLSNADLDRDGLISFEEFKIFITGKGKKDFLRQHEINNNNDDDGDD
jgi:Ca2+-binding EF-hand superfamily protein